MIQLVAGLALLALGGACAASPKVADFLTASRWWYEEGLDLVREVLRIGIAAVLLLAGFFLLVVGIETLVA